MHHFGSTGSVRPNSLGRTCHSHVKLKSYQVKRLKSNQGSSASKMSRLCRTACLSLVLLFGEIFELVLSICSQLLRYWELLLPLLIPVKSNFVSWTGPRLWWDQHSSLFEEQICLTKDVRIRFKIPFFICHA